MIVKGTVQEILRVASSLRHSIVAIWDVAGSTDESIRVKMNCSGIWHLIPTSWVESLSIIDVSQCGDDYFHKVLIEFHDQMKPVARILRAHKSDSRCGCGVQSISGTFSSLGHRGPSWVGNVQGTLTLNGDWHAGDCVMKQGATLTVHPDGTGTLQGVVYSSHVDWLNKNTWHIQIDWFSSTDSHNALAEWPQGHSYTIGIPEAHIDYPFKTSFRFQNAEFARFANMAARSSC